MRNKKDDVLCEIAKAEKIIEEKTGINRDEFDKYPSEDLIKILIGMLTASQISFFKENVKGYEYPSDEKKYQMVL
ncbi:hypothetical protein ABKW02_04495 [Enterobacter cloacae]|uniref:hypothetical protein n=1 Tax=Enterobacter cloacae complex TaxID=354276 RepID=UPI0022F035C6|nr:hypothetical protein [Enterobacter hormaechei]MCE1457876.1 hypothetical protein [Enterobacter hormaechei]WBT25250.1 hypothetical protein PF325_08415 [Enterobacter hormaechei]